MTIDWKMADQSEQSKNQLQSIFHILTQFRYLSDSSIIDFFVNDLWSKLPSGWRKYLDSIDFQELADLLDLDRSFCGRSDVPPLSLLALRQCSWIYSLRRKPSITADHIDRYIGLDRSIGWLCGDRRGKNQSISSDHVISVNNLADCNQSSDQSQQIIPNDQSNNHGSSADQSIILPRPNRSIKSSDRLIKRSLPSDAFLHMNPKKKHEITRLADLIDRLMRDFDQKSITILDVGSGCGHLARYLSLIKGIRTITIEAKKYFIDRAKLFDQKAAARFGRSEFELPIHQNNYFDESALKMAKSMVDGDQEGKTWMIGLHTCGNLASDMIRSFVNDPMISVLISISCCYMKLTTDSDRNGDRSMSSVDQSSDQVISADKVIGSSISTDQSIDQMMVSILTDQSITGDQGYPMSVFTKSIIDCELSYAAREISCHALEQYVIKLRSMDDQYMNSLKSHCYRAALETLITRKYPHRRREGIRSVKNIHRMNLKEYAHLALEKLDGIDSDVITEGDIDQEWTGMINQWKRVLIFHSIRLLVAPLIESAILIDRMLFLKENGCGKSWILPVFDAQISPRNFMVLVMKEN